MNVHYNESTVNNLKGLCNNINVNHLKWQCNEMTVKHLKWHCNEMTSGESVWIYLLKHDLQMQHGGYHGGYLNH